MSEEYEFEVIVQERSKYVSPPPDDPRSIGKYKTREEAVRAGLEFQMDHQDHGFRVFYKRQEMVCQPAPSR